MSKSFILRAIVSLILSQIIAVVPLLIAEHPDWRFYRFFSVILFIWFMLVLSRNRWMDRLEKFVLKKAIESPLTPVQRVEAYRFALNHLEDRSTIDSGLCNLLFTYYIQKFQKSMITYYTVMDLFPELLQHRPYGASNGDYWWPLQDRLSRITVLQLMINEINVTQDDCEENTFYQARTA